jgi:hypothetical protein
MSTVAVARVAVEPDGDAGERLAHQCRQANPE